MKSPVNFLPPLPPSEDFFRVKFSDQDEWFAEGVASGQLTFARQKLHPVVDLVRRAIRELLRMAHEIGMVPPTPKIDFV